MNPKNPAEDKQDRLAGVLLYLLVSDGKDGLSVEQLAQECERDAEFTEDRVDVARALGVLAEHDLATHGADGLWRPTRAAIMAEHLHQIGA